MVSCINELTLLIGNFEGTHWNPWDAGLHAGKWKWTRTLNKNEFLCLVHGSQMLICDMSSVRFPGFSDQTLGIRVCAISCAHNSQWLRQSPPSKYTSWISTNGNTNKIDRGQQYYRRSAAARRRSSGRMWSCRARCHWCRPPAPPARALHPARPPEVENHPRHHNSHILTGSLLQCMTVVAIHYCHAMEVVASHSV